uniref:Serine-threonine kinase receptor-associated protein n=1 Tax=Ditylum brightwellii TaxID=49249 RepID=A0A7S4RSE8_9STRA
MSVAPETTTTTTKDNGPQPSSRGRQIPIVCPGHTRPLAELSFCTVEETKAEERTFLVSACHDKMPMLRDAKTGDWIGTFAGHKGAVWSCRLDPLGLLAGTASGDFSVKIWDAITGSSLFTYPHKHIVKTLDFSPDSKYIATGGHEGLLRVFDLRKEKEETPILTIKQNGEKTVTITKCNWLNATTVLAAGSDGSINYWNVDPKHEGEEQHRLMGTLKVDAEVRDMELSKDFKTLTVAAGTKVYFFDVENKSLLCSHQMPIHFRDEGGASLHPDGKKFVAGGSDLWVRVFDYETGTELECHKGHHGPVRCVRYDPDGKTYATGSEDGTIRLWKTDP